MSSKTDRYVGALRESFQPKRGSVLTWIQFFERVLRILNWLFETSSVWRRGRLWLLWSLSLGDPLINIYYFLSWILSHRIDRISFDVAIFIKNLVESHRWFIFLPLWLITRSSPRSIDRSSHLTHTILVSNYGRKNLFLHHCFLWLLASSWSWVSDSTARFCNLLHSISIL